jgi:hypothetical protein
MIHHALNAVPLGSRPNKVDVDPVTKDGRNALRITLDLASRSGQPGVDFVDQPSFLLMPDVIEDALIQLDVCARLLPDAPDYARGFIGLAYRIQPDLSAYESLYLRPTNGKHLLPDPPRDQRAVQYYAYPDWPFDVLREREPGRFEAGADIGLNQWHKMAILLEGRQFSLSVDDTLVLQGSGKIAAQSGAIGLWVDIGTEGYFSNLRLSKR